MDALLRRRIMMMHGGGPSPSPVPTGYTPVEYIELPGSAYISFGDRGSESHDAVEVDLQITTLTAQMRIVSYTSSGNPFQLYVTGTLGLGYRFSGTYYGMSGVTLDTNRHKVGIDYVNKQVWCDTTVETFSGTSSLASGGNIGIGVKMGSNPQLKAKIYGGWQRRDGVLLHNLVMCRGANYDPYVWDTVAQEFRTIGGSGASVGPDIIIP